MNPPHADLIFSALRSGEYGTALLLLDRPIDNDDGEEGALSLVAVGALWLALGQDAQAQATLSEAFERAAQLERKMNMAAAGAVAYLGLWALLGGHPEARDQFAAVQVMERALKRRFGWLNATWGLGETLLRWEPPELALADGQLRRALVQAQAGGNHADILEVVTAQADLAWRRGHPEQALSLLAAGEGTADNEHERASLIYRRRARLWLQLGEATTSDHWLDQADQEAERRAATIPNPEVRQSYLDAQSRHTL